MKLQIKDESGKTTVVPITRDEITIGRKEGNTIRLTERNVSRTHARFLKKGDEIHVEDVSRYGTRVNGERITETRRVGAGDTIQIGDYLLSLEGVKAVEDPAQMKQAAAGAAAAAVSQSMTEFKGNEKKRAELEAAAKNQIAAAKAEMGEKGGASAKKKEPTIPPGGKKDLEQTGEVSGDELRRSRGQGKKRIGANHPTLVAVTTHLAGSEYPITTETMILGRTGENDLKVDHHSISRNHAKIVMKDGKVRMVDLQSKNGIRVNGEYWEESSLKSGDIIELGKVQFRFVEKGEEFIFRPEDYTEEARAEEPKKGGKGMLVAILLLAAGGIAALYFLVIAKPSDKPIVPNVPVGNTMAPPQPTSEPPTQPATQPDVAVAAPDTVAAAAPDTAVATAPPPTPVDNTVAIKDLLDKASAAAGAQKWDEASQHLDALLALDAEHAQAKALQAKVASEKAVQAAFAEAQAAQGKNDLLGTWKALQKLAAMPPDSSYAAAVTEMRGAVGSAIANGLVDQAKQALTKKQWNDAIAMAEEAQKYLPNHAEAPEVIAKARRLKADEARRDAQRDQPKEPPPPKEPAGKSADELYKEARALHNTDEAAALKLYEQAAGKGYASAHKMIASIKIKRGDNKGAVASYKKYLELVPGAKDGDTVRDIITKLGGTP